MIHTEHILALGDAFRSAAPYKYASVGRLFDIAELAAIEQEIAQVIASIPQEKNIYASFKKHKLSTIGSMPANTQKMVAFLNSPEFLSVIEVITGIENLHGDPDLQGGGIHVIGRGGFLKLHTDFNWHKKLGLHRRLNLLIYLNSEWMENWGGAIELWNSNATEKMAAYFPHLGEALIFETTDNSYHGHPEPLACPEGRNRKSIAMYYYTKTRPDSDIIIGKSEMTNYKERPGETFVTDKLRRARHAVQLRVKKNFFSIKRFFYK